MAILTFDSLPVGEHRCWRSSGSVVVPEKVRLAFCSISSVVVYLPDRNKKKKTHRGSNLTIIFLVTRLPAYASEFIEMCLMITADHGPG